MSTSDNFVSDIVSGLERFAADMRARKLERYRVTTWHFLDEPCPVCGCALVRGRGFTSCTGKWCRYSWAPESEVSE